MYSQVLVPLDGSEASERALPHAQRLADAFGGRVHLLQILSLSPEYAVYRAGGEEGPTVIDSSIDMAEEITAARQTKAEAYLRATAARLEEGGIDVHTAVRQGLTLDTIANFVEENGIDLIVMSTHGRSGLQRFLIGSVTDRVIRFSHVPVLAIPPGD
jgi:nucleotide-binding universal stress UspA family protein